MPGAMVTKRGADRIRNGHLWIYRSDVIDASEVAGGSITALLDQHGNFVGQAFYSDRSEIALRLLTRSDEAINRDWWFRRIHRAAQRRKVIAHNTNAYRLFYSEGDLIPSLIIDRYDDVLVLQTLSQGSEVLKSTFVELLIEQFSPRTIFERNDVRVRVLEGLPLVTGVLYGDPVDQVEATQDGLRFIVVPMGGQKTGSFLDQRENRLAAQSYAHGRALDCFTFAGGFALHLSRVCERVVGIDIS
ncbi:MAG: class I SAM-dependent rRNA methyltransferase, partial [Acidobacteria bacterium]